MSSGTSQAATSTMSWEERAAREASGAHREALGAHQNTNKLMDMLQERLDEADPLGAISEAQLFTIDRQAKVLDLLRQVLEMLTQVRAMQGEQGLEMQALRMETQTLRTEIQTEMRPLRSRCDETYALLVRAIRLTAPPAASPKPA